MKGGSGDRWRLYVTHGMSFLHITGEAKGREAETGERDAWKLARPVRGGADGKGPGMVPRRRPTPLTKSEHKIAC
jgi:hypothetical protein